MLRMSTRAWYEYYVIDRAKNELSLAMQFYKWGDASVHNAVCDLEALLAATGKFGGSVPVRHVTEMLKDNLGDAVESLPPAFALGAYYFLIQRAFEEVRSPFRGLRYHDLPEEERPDYKLGYAVGVAKVERGRVMPRHDDPVIERAHFSIQVGTLVRRWLDCSTRMNFLRWLQYITQFTREIEMGCIAGEYVKSDDISYTYRLFFTVPGLDEVEQRIESIGLEICDAAGRPLRQALLDELEGVPTEDRHLEPRRTPPAELRRVLEERVSLEDMTRAHHRTTSPFWEGRLPRGGYLGP